MSRRYRIVSVAFLAMFWWLAYGCGKDNGTKPSPPSIFTVSPDGTGDFSTIQAALEAASRGDIVELTDGVFKGDGNRDIDFLGKAVTVRSGSGDPGSCIIDCEGDTLDPHRGFNFKSGEESDSVLKGLTIRNGYAPVDTLQGGEPLPYGGGILCVGSSPTIAGCRFSQNYGVGSSMVCYDSSPAIVDCTFSEGQNGGYALMCLGSTPTVSGCAFSGNEGGAAMICSNSQASLKNCVFSDNFGTEAGGLACYYFSSVSLVGCVFSNNSSGYGGAMMCYEFSRPTLSDCTFSGNSGGTAGALYCSPYSGPTLVNCTLYGNSGNTAGGICCDTGSPPTLENTIIAFSSCGRALRCEAESNPTCTCCNFYGNEGGDGIIPGTDGNISKDPHFCDPENGDLRLQVASPCSPDSTACGLMGAWPVGCD